MRRLFEMFLISSLCFACVSRRAVRPDELLTHPLEVPKGRLDVELSDGRLQRFDAPVSASASHARLHVKPQDGWAELPLERVAELTIVKPSEGRTAALALGGCASVAVIVGIVVFAALYKGPPLIQIPTGNWGSLSGFGPID